MEKAYRAKACYKTNYACDDDEAPVVLNCQAGENPEHGIPAVRAWSPSVSYYDLFTINCRSPGGAWIAPTYADVSTTRFTVIGCHRLRCVNLLVRIARDL
jgi:hypothetical protein